MGEQYKQLQFRDRLKIEARLNIGYKPKQIAADLGVHVSTIYREVKRRPRYFVEKIVDGEEEQQMGRDF